MTKASFSDKPNLFNQKKNLINNDNIKFQLMFISIICNDSDKYTRDFFSLQKPQKLKSSF